MSAVTVEKATIAETLKIDLLESPTSDFPSTLLLPDQPASLIPKIEPYEAKSWDPTIFHSLVQDARNGDVGAVHGLAELSTTEIQNGNLGEVLRSISAVYDGDDSIQKRIREIVMKQYMIVLEEKNTGLSTYDAVTRPAVENQSFRPRTGINFTAIDPGY